MQNDNDNLNKKMSTTMSNKTIRIEQLNRLPIDR
jgi:hypothetical protein